MASSLFTVLDGIQLPSLNKFKVDSTLLLSHRIEQKDKDSRWQGLVEIVAAKTAIGHVQLLIF